MLQERKLVRVGCYVRVSTENQIENYSIEEQIERLKAYCKAKDWCIYKCYTDAGFSGGNMDRPALNQMLDDIHLHKIDMVVVYKLDRLSRSQKDTLMMIEDEFLTHGIDFVSMNENFDTSTPFGRAMIGILSVFSQLEKDQITERFTMGRIGRSKAGYYHGGSIAPTGYNYMDGHLVVDKYKALQVSEVFQRFMAGHSIHSIQRHMHEIYGGWNSHSLLTNILRNSVYIGNVKFKGNEYPGLHQPIISPEDFSTVQQLLQSYSSQNQLTTQKTPFRAAYLLSSLIFCGCCKSRYSANHGYYKCYSRSKSSKRFVIDPDCKNKNWKIEQLDILILNELKKLKYDMKYLSSNFDQRVNPFSPDQIKSIELHIKELDRQRAKVIELYQLGMLSMDEITGRIDDLQREKNVLKEKIVLYEPSNATQIPISKILNDLDGVFSTGGLIERRMFVSSLIEAIYIDGEQVTIKWRI